MRFVRRASLVFSLVLIVAIVVGYVARHSELAGQRDTRLTTAADLGATRFSALLDAVTVAARAGTDPRTTIDAFASRHPEVGVCAVATDVEPVCGGRGPQPTADVVEDLRAIRSADQLRDDLQVVVYEAMMTIEVDGPVLSLAVRAPVSVMRDPVGPSVFASTVLPAGAEDGGFAVDKDLRQTAADVAAVPDLFVVASGDDAVHLPGDEQRFYLIIFTLAVLLLALAGITLFVEQRNLLERASFDSLTKLPNRSEFERRAADAIATAERQGTGLCLLLFDLNGFKQVNDTYGHQTGDEMLKVVGSRLRKAVRDGDIVARWGGDEFVVVMPGIDNDEMGTKRARQLAEQVSGRTRLEGVDVPLRVRVSVGVAIASGEGIDLDALVESADKAMYQAKRDGLVSLVSDDRNGHVPLAAVEA